VSRIGVEHVKLHCPGLVDFDDEDAVSRLMATIQTAEMDVDEKSWGSFYERGVAFLTGHRTLLDQRASAGDDAGVFPVEQASADGLNQKVVIPQNLRAETAHYYTTIYGTRYMELARLVGGGPRLVA